MSELTLIPQECFCAHLQAWPAKHHPQLKDKKEGYPHWDDPVYRKIVRDTRARLTDLCSNFDQKYLSTLVIISGGPDGQSWSMIDGVLTYAGFEESETELDRGRKEYASQHSAFIVTKPGDPESETRRFHLEDQDEDIYHQLDPGRRAWRPIYRDHDEEAWGNRETWMSISPPPQGTS
jgi:hypothetical protein